MRRHYRNHSRPGQLASQAFFFTPRSNSNRLHPKYSSKELKSVQDPHIVKPNDHRSPSDNRHCRHHTVNRNRYFPSEDLAQQPPPSLYSPSSAAYLHSCTEMKVSTVLRPAFGPRSQWEHL